MASSEATAIVVQPRPPPSPNPSTEHHAVSESPLSNPKSCIEPNPAQSLTDHQVSARVLLEQISIKASHGDIDATVATEHQIGLVVKQPTAPPYQLIDGKRWGAIMCFLLHVLLSSSYNWDSSMLDEASTVGDKWINPAGTWPAAAPNFCQVIAICESNYGEGTSLPHLRHRAFLDVLSPTPDTHPIPYNGCPPFMLWGDSHASACIANRNGEVVLKPYCDKTIKTSRLPSTEQTPGSPTWWPRATTRRTRRTRRPPRTTR